MVKVRGKKVSPKLSEYVTKDLIGPRGKRKKVNKNKKQQDKLAVNGDAVVATATPGRGKRRKVAEESHEDAIGEVAGNEVLLPETRTSDAPPIRKVTFIILRSINHYFD